MTTMKERSVLDVAYPSKSLKHEENAIQARSSLPLVLFSFLAAMSGSFWAGQYAGSSFDLSLNDVVPEPLQAFTFSIAHSISRAIYTHRESNVMIYDRSISNDFDKSPESLFELGPLEPMNTIEANRLILNHATGGQHLLIDIDNVNEEFLSSEDHLTNALINLVEQRDELMLLSHRCQCGSKSMDIVSCVGIFVDSHVFVHAWPAENRFKISFFTASPIASVELLIPAIEKSFAMPRLDGSVPRLKSVYKKRGFELEQDFPTTSISLAMLGNNTRNQEQVVDTKESSSGKIRQDDAAYYEALVHPAMLVHPNPQRVAVIGSSAVVREVLKHNTVETCVVLEQGLEVISRTHNDCSDFIGITAECLNDTRVMRMYADGQGSSEWFIERFSQEDDIDDEDKFDVIIMESSDAFLFDDAAKMSTVFRNALTEDGVLVTDVGIADKLNDPGYSYHNKERLDIAQAMWQPKFEVLKTYTEKRVGAAAPRSFYIAFCNFEDSKTTWYSNEAEFDLSLVDRRVQTVSGENPFRHFDGATMMLYQFPSRITEEVYCHSSPAFNECGDGHGYNPEIPNAPVTAFEVKMSAIEGAGRGVYFKEDFNAGTYLCIDSGVHGMFVMPSTFATILDMAKKSTVARDVWEPLESYMDGYGFDHAFYGNRANVVDPGLITFVNHGCNGTNNVGLVLNVTELDADINIVPDEIDRDTYEDHFYSPYTDRHHWILSGAAEQTRVDVKAGDEVLDNYLTFYATWPEAVTALRSECQGIATGTVVDYERKRDESTAV